MFGLFLAALGALLVLAERYGVPLGRLPGDVSFGRGNWRVYLPITTSIVVSLLLTLLFTLLSRR